MSSDISNYVRRTSKSDRSDINKILSIINPLAFPDPENTGLKERIVLDPEFRKRTITSAQGLDITGLGSETRSRDNTALTIIPSTSTTTAKSYSTTLTGDITYSTSKKNGAGALFTGTQYVTFTDTGNELDLSSGQFGMAFWFKGNGIDQGEQTIYSKRVGDLIRDYCESCGDYDTGDYFTSPSSLNAGLTVTLIGNPVEDYCSACTDFNTNDFATTATAAGVRVVMADGSNSVDGTVTTSTIFDGSWHSIIINASDIVSDYCSACGDYDTDDYSVTTTPRITVYLDGVSQGTIDHSAITGSLGNAESAYFGAQDNGGTKEKLLKGDIALWEFQEQVFSTTAISDYHSNARIRTTAQKAALHFVGNAFQLDVVDNLY